MSICVHESLCTRYASQAERRYERDKCERLPGASPTSNNISPCSIYMVTNDTKKKKKNSATKTAADIKGTNPVVL